MAKVKTVELGCPGHLIVSSQCRWRRHTQVGKKYRVSTLGDYYSALSGKRETLGGADDSFFETMVFATTGTVETNNEDCGCLTVKDWSELDGKRYPTAGAAQRGHEAFMAKYVRLLSRARRRAA